MEFENLTDIKCRIRPIRHFQGAAKAIRKKSMEITDKTTKNKDDGSSDIEHDIRREKTHRRSIMVLGIVISIVFSSIFGAAFGFMSANLGGKFFPNLINPSLRDSLKNKEIVRQQIIEEDSAVTEVVGSSSPAVVSIVISKDVPKFRNFSPFDFPDFFNPFGNEPDLPNDGGTEKQRIGGGSGFLITKDGMIVTNKHVVTDPAADYTAITTDGKEHSARVLARDPVNDIAVMKIDGSDFPTLSLGNSDDLKTGQSVIAIGNSLGEFSNTVSKGIISGLKRTVTAGSGFGGNSETLTNIIQTDAAINPGNSGGPLLNINGEVIGVNVAMAQGAQNIGFAIPSNQIQRVVDQVKTTGKITTPYIGVRFIPVDEIMQKENNLPFNYGALVARGQRMTDFAVIPGSPADKAGVVENDIILEINGTKVDEKNGLTEQISKLNVGDTVKLKVWHKGETKELSLTLDERQ